MKPSDNPHPSADLLHRFIFDDIPLRGEIITLCHSLEQAARHQSLNDAARGLLGEFLAASSLLAETFKFSGTLTLQARGDGAVPLIMAEATHDHTVRGLIKFSENNQKRDLPSVNLADNVGAGILTLTVDPEQGQRYQGIVSLEHTGIADCISAYFNQSEQLPSQMWLFADRDRVSGLFLQTLPPAHDQPADPEVWRTITTLADTLTADEILTLDHQTVLLRLFHEYQVRLFDPSPVAFACSCSRERSLNALSALTAEDARALLVERDWIQMNCEFCGAEYHFGSDDLDALFGPSDRSVH